VRLESRRLPLQWTSEIALRPVRPPPPPPPRTRTENGERTLLRRRSLTDSENENSAADCTQFVKAGPPSLPPFLRRMFRGNPRKPSVTRVDLRARAACTMSIRVELLRRVTESFRSRGDKEASRRSIQMARVCIRFSLPLPRERNYPASTIRASSRIDVGILPAIPSRY